MSEGGKYKNSLKEVGMGQFSAAEVLSVADGRKPAGPQAGRRVMPCSVFLSSPIWSPDWREEGMGLEEG